jgi:hypothetical protein
MNFSVKEWRRMYDAAHELGVKLKNSRPTYDEDYNYYPPISPLTRGQQASLEDRIQIIMEKNNQYLDQCDMKMPKPLWVYDRLKPDTHRSSKHFKYDHLQFISTLIST